MRIEKVKKLTPMEIFLYWVQERESIRIRRLKGQPKPWTDDEILQKYRFCNVRRMDDKVSVWLLDHWYGPYSDHPNMLFAVALARFFNLPSSLKAIEKHVFIAGNPASDPNWAAIQGTLRAKKLREETVFNGAYMVRGNDGMDKIQSVVDYFVRPLESVEIDPTSMEATWKSLLKCYGFGSFMAGQIVADLRWSVVGAWEDKNSWAPKGPGSMRGLNRLQGRSVTCPVTQREFLDKLTNLVEHYKPGLPSILTATLEMHDYQNCLCEYDKYVRVLLGEGRPKQKFAGC